MRGGRLPPAAARRAWGRNGVGRAALHCFILYCMHFIALYYIALSHATTHAREGMYGIVYWNYQSTRLLQLLELLDVVIRDSDVARPHRRLYLEHRAPLLQVLLARRSLRGRRMACSVHCGGALCCTTHCHDVRRLGSWLGVNCPWIGRALWRGGAAAARPSRARAGARWSTQRQARAPCRRRPGWS